jgi:DNA-binding transcriptional LysR family regulator
LGKGRGGGEDPAIGDRSLMAVDPTERIWLLRESGSGTRALNEQFLQDRGLSPGTLSLGSNGAIKQAARVGFGVSLLSRAAVEADLATGRLAELHVQDGPATRPWFVLRSAVGPPRTIVDLFVNFARLASRRAQ